MYLSDKTDIRKKVHMMLAFKYVHEMLQRLRPMKTREMGQELIFEMYCKLVINSFGLTDHNSKPVGTLLDLELSKMDHSCDPDVKVLNSGRFKFVVALKELKDSDLSKVFSI